MHIGVADGNHQIERRHFRRKVIEITQWIGFTKVVNGNAQLRRGR